MVLGMDLFLYHQVFKKCVGNGFEKGLPVLKSQFAKNGIAASITVHRSVLLSRYTTQTKLYRK